MKKLLRILITLALALSLLMLASCGDDDDKNTPLFPGEGVHGPIIPYD